jgi:hypothetical protein
MSTDSHSPHVDGRPKREGRRNFFKRVATGSFAGVTTAGAVGVLAANARSSPSFIAEKEGFKERVLRELDQLIQTTGSEGSIQIQIDALRKRMDDVFQKLDECNQCSGSMNDIQGVRQTLFEIKRVLNIP